LGRIITLEQGKPHAEAVGEVEYAAGFFGFFATQMDRLKPERLPIESRGCRWTLYRRPAGVVGLLSSWNFPIAMMAKKLAPALATGCGIVAKPATPTPLTMIAFWNLLESLDFATALKGRLNLVIGPGGVIGKTLCEHPAVRLVSCTGSMETGRALMRNSANHIKRLELELGGNAPFVGFEDADLDEAARALIANKFRCAGQTCVCVNRVYAQKKVEEEL
jgi:succinate-semialdehyde dehydrogenase / glutarate-semialdehyde dehydrogenase